MGRVLGYFDAQRALDRVVLAQSHLDYEGVKAPLVIAVSEPLGQGRSPFVRELFVGLHELKLKCALIPLSGFYLPRATLRERGLLDQKGAPSTIAMDHYFETLKQARGVRRSGDEVPHPNHTPMRADPAPSVRAVTASTDVVITEGPWVEEDFSGYASILRRHVDQIWRLDVGRSEAMVEYEAEV